MANMIRCFIVDLCISKQGPLQWQKLEKILMGPKYKLLLSVAVISHVYRSFIFKNPTFFKYCLTLDFKQPGSFEIHWVRQYLVIIVGPAGIVKATFDKIEPI